MKRFSKALLSILLCAALLAGGILVPARVSAAQTSVLVLDGQPVRNVGANNYTVHANVVKSYLSPLADGSFVRVCATLDDTLLAEWYSADGKLQKTKTVEYPLFMFGGFYFGETYNFAIYGQQNLNEDPEAVVMEAVRYDKEMNALDSVTMRGMNTYIPFDAGSCRFAEAGGQLYIYTCHEMFDRGDGKHHQANVTLRFDTSPLKLVEEVTSVAGNYAGYVSHSFNQFIAVDGKFVYRADHGDAYPRGLYLSRTATDTSVTAVTYTVPLRFPGGTGINSTGATLGGMALTKTNVLLAVSIDSQTAEYTHFYDRSAGEQRNILVVSADKSLNDDQNRSYRVTNYAADANIDVRTPHLTAIGGDTALLMWEETDRAKSVTVTRACLLNALGQPKTDIYTLEARLSDCAPVLGPDGCVYWYVSEEDSSTDDGTPLLLYRLNPAHIADFTPLKHNWQVTKTITAATCETDGEGEYTCAVCGIKKTETIPALGHDWDRWLYGGFEEHVRLCKNDPSHEEHGLHNWETVYVETPPTCTKKGTGQVYCPICGFYVTGTVFLPAHDWGAWKPYTDTLHKRVCKADASHTETAKHRWKKTGETAPTATQNGSIVYTCKDCGAERTEILPATDLKFMPGDVNLNNKVGTDDARLALRAAIGLEHYEKGSLPFLAADVAAPLGELTTADARRILRAAIGLEQL